MRKKTVLAIILMLSLCITGAAITGCAPKKPDFMFTPYTRYEEQVTTPTTDIATLDGKFEEQIWSGVTWHNMTSTERNRTGTNAGLSGFSTDVAYSATAVTSEKGLYVGIKSEDPVLYVGSKWDDFNRKSQQVPQSAFAKTGVSIYVGGNAVKWKQGVVEIGFAIDGEISANYWTSGNKSSKLGTIGMLSGVDLKGAQLNVQDGEGYAIEAFVPWTALPFFDVKPETVRATYASHRYADFDLEEITSVKRCWEMLDSGNGHEWVTPTGWYVYGDAGRIVQQGSETFGMGNGVLEYDSGFDLSLDKVSEGANRKVTFTAPTSSAEVRHARLYVKDLKDTVMYAKAKFTVDTAALGGVLNNIDAYPMAGLTFLGADKVNGKMGVVNMGVTLAKDAASNNPPYFNSRYSAVTTDTQNFVGARKYYTSDPFDPTTADGFTLAVYRDGTQFYLICNGVHYATVQSDFITASTETFIALTTVNLPVTVSEYTFACGADIAGTVNMTPTLAYTDGKAVDAAKLSLQGKQLTFTNKADPTVTYSATVGADNAVSAIAGMKVGTYTVTTTAMGGNLKVHDFVCVGDGNATGVLRLRLNSTMDEKDKKMYQASLGENGLNINAKDNRTTGYMLLEGLSLSDEAWFGGTVRLSGNGASLNYGSKIGFSFTSDGGLTSVKIGHMDNEEVSGDTKITKAANTAWVWYYDSDGANKGVKGEPVQITGDALAALKNADGVQVAIHRTASNDLEVYFNGTLFTTIAANDHTIRGAITGFGVRLNIVYTGDDFDNVWLHNVNYTTAETLNTTVQLKYANGNAIDASKVSFQGAQFAFTNKADPNTKYTVTVSANNVIPAIPNMKVGAYTVTTTAMGGKLKVNDFVCVGDGNATCTLGVQLTNNINTTGSYKAELGNGFTVNNIVGVRPTGNLFMTGLNLTGVTWFGGTIRLSGDSASLQHGSAIALYFKTATIDRWIEFYGEDGNPGVRFYNTTTNSYESTTYTMTTDEKNALKSQNGLRVAVCRTAGGKLEVYLVVGETLGTKVVEYDLGTEAITGFGVRLNAINTGAADNGAAWIKNVQFGTQAEILGA